MDDNRNELRPPLRDDQIVRRLLDKKRYIQVGHPNPEAFLLKVKTETREAERDLSVHIVEEISLGDSMKTRDCVGSTTLLPSDIRAIVQPAPLDVVRDPDPVYKASIIGLANPDENPALAYALASLLAEVAKPEP